MTDTIDRETRIKRLRIRSWRRGTKEMDMILGPFADSGLDGLDDAAGRLPDMSSGTIFPG